MTSDQIYIGIGPILVLAVARQLVGKLLGLPSLILLLPVGFVAGALTDDVNPNAVLGPAFQPIASLCTGQPGDRTILLAAPSTDREASHDGR